ncbi:MAG: hypothetical protein J6K57_02655 [Alistipes sp.]|nr:hypothetical protein [Alistipes sp.]
MRTTIYRVWRVVIVTLFLLTVACSGKDVSGNPQAVDALTVEYIMHDLSADIERTDKNVLSVERVKLTRQDAIPIALVDVVYKDGTTGREFYGFDYQQIVSVCELLDKEPKMTAAQAAAALQMSENGAATLLTIARRAKGLE